MKSTPILLAVFAVSLAGNVWSADLALPEAADLPETPGLPDPLVMLDGRHVTTASQWNADRRPELKRLFAYYMYGPLPARPKHVQFHVDAVHNDFMGGQATLKLVTIGFGDPTGPRIDLLLVVPNARQGRVPVFLGMNFCGNQALTDDPRVPLTRGWVYTSCGGCVDGHATGASRGSQAGDWSIDQILARGYAFAAFCSSDVDSDRGGVSDGIYAWQARQAGQPAPSPQDRGTIAAWAWGFHRCVDYLVTDRDLNPRQIAVVGHSRNGKTALLAGALDERIALSIPLQAGCGGTAPNRGTVGESVKAINTAFPHWFNARFKAFNAATDRLPFDQHCLVALMAPRPVLLANATEDQWANPAGQFAMLQAAEPVYRLLGGGPLEADRMPPENQLVASKLGYYIRPGKHSMTRGDWKVFLDFADIHFGRAAAQR